MSKKEKSIAFVNMAFASGTVTNEESVGYDMYTGIASFKVLGVNSSIETLKKWYPNRDYEAKPPKYEYNKEGDSKGTFVTFYIKTDPESSTCKGVDFHTRCSYLVKNEISMNKDKTKIQVINELGEDGWLTSEEFKNKVLPEYMVNNGFNMQGMRPAFVGETLLVDFLRKYLGIEEPRKWNNDLKKWEARTGDDYKAAICGFTAQEISKIAQGDVSPVIAAIKARPDNNIKLICGVRTTADNKEFQDVCTRLPISAKTFKYDYAIKQLQAMKDGGSYANTYFGEPPYKFQKYVVNPTDFAKENKDVTDIDDIFGDYR